jgi:hypothetical protein
MNLTLYRGDSTKIKEFEVKKTNKYCLLGQGIYLTDKLSIAHSYREKDVPTRHILFNGAADNRIQALDLSFETFCKAMWEKEHLRSEWWSKAPENVKRKYRQSNRKLFLDLIDNKKIQADYTSPPPVTAINNKYHKASSIIAAQKELEKNHTRYLKVVWNEEPNAGFVTKFEFNKNEFDTKVFHVDKACNDEFFWTLMHDAKLDVGIQTYDLAEYLKHQVGRNVYNSVDSRSGRYGSKNVWSKIAKIIEPYGFVGFEYNGGSRLGGGYNHRAFSIWDEEYVNDHKVQRFK